MGNVGMTTDPDAWERVQDGGHWANPDQLAPPDTNNDDDTATPGDGWATLDLATIAAEGYTRPTPRQLIRADGHALIYENALNFIYGPSGVGKSWTWIYAARDTIWADNNVIIIDLEDGPQTTIQRLTSIGVTIQQIVDHVHYIRPQSPLGWPELGWLRQLTETHHHKLIVIDSLGEAFAMAGINENNDNEVGPFLRNYMRPLADTGAAVLVIDHATKAQDNPLFPSGSKRKRAAVTGAMHQITAITPFVENEGGRLRITCAKDRHGHYRTGATVAELVMTSNGDQIGLTLYPPTQKDAATDGGIAAMARAAHRAADNEGIPVSQRALIELMTKHKGSTDKKRAGIELATSRGWLIETSGPRRSRMFTAVNPDDKQATPDPHERAGF